MKRLTIAIAGLGLIGGSMALALRRRGCRILGIDRDPSVLRAALERGAADEAGGPELLREAELLVLALSPETAMAFLRENRSLLLPGTVVTDVCGVKRAVVEVCSPLCREAGLHFIGGHPMAGKEHSGFDNADADLFQGASYILTPEEDTSPAAIALLRELAAALGCGRITVTTPDDHDRLIAFTSQLPHVLAGAYVKSPACLEHEGYSAGSYRDVSRVATVDEKLWSELFLLNAAHLTQEIDGLIRNLSACRDAVAAGDRPRLEEVLRRGRAIKESLQMRKAGAEDET